MNLLPRLSILSSNFNWYFMMIVMSPWSSDHNADLFACLFQLVFDESTPCMSTPGLSFNWYLINLLVVYWCVCFFLLPRTKNPHLVSYLGQMVFDDQSMMV